MSRALALVLAVLLALGPASVHAAGPVGALGEAQASFNAGDYYQTAELVAPLLDDEDLAKADRATALRLYGLALYFLGKRAEADAMLFEYLKLEPRAHLDPALVPPEGIAFFENVRSTHARELAPYDRPEWTDSAVLSVVPLAGQLQNGEKAKGWALVTTEALLAATTVTTYFMFRSRCDDGLAGTCSPEGEARALRTVNLVSGGLLAVVVVYGVVDGAMGYRRRKRAFDAAGVTVGLVPAGSGRSGVAGLAGASLSWTVRF